jgi:hypothetical protein
MTAARHQRRKILERAWILVGFGYSLVRIFIAELTVRKYGINIWAFAAVELVSSGPYSLGTARVVARLVDRNYHSALKWGTLAAVCFLAPEAFIVATGQRCSKRRPGHCHSMPTKIYVAIGVVVLLLGSVSIWSIRRKVKRATPLVQPDPSASDAH